MQYISTRGASAPVTSAEAIKNGLAPDGGLYLPDEIPAISPEFLEELIPLPYPQRAAKILHLYLSDSYSEEELLADCTAAYDEARFPGGAAPLSLLGERVRVLELWHGPTCAFKDMALQLMPRLLSRALAKTGEKRDACILVATSGDTGKAALEGYRDVPHTRITVFYPVDGVSRVQKLQMATQTGENVSVHSVVGNFDDAQNGVKAIFSDSGAAKALGEKNYFSSSANSINWGRLAPQIVYYISAYCDMVKAGDIKPWEEIDVCVPTGNFGDILAGYYAKKMGLPFCRLLCASNQNDVLTDFFRTGTYDRRRPFFQTVSPSMDILISSNLERLLAMTAGSEITAGLMKELKENGCYTVSPALLAALTRDFAALSCDEEGTAKTIREVYGEFHYLCDTHTAVGLSCAFRFLAGGEDRKILSVSTASPYKFAPAVCRAITGQTFPDELDAMSALAAHTGTEIPAPLAGIASRTVRFDPDASILPSAMRDTVLSEL